MTLKEALFKGANPSHIKNIWSRHATPVRMCHIVFGVDAYNEFDVIDTTATWVVAPYHDTLGDWASVDGYYKRPDGGPLHMMAGLTPDPIPQPGSIDFTTLEGIDVFVLGHIDRWHNGEDANGNKIFAVEWTDSYGDAFRDSIKSVNKIWETGEDWEAVDNIYKYADGYARADTIHVNSTISTVTWSDPE